MTQMKTTLLSILILTLISCDATTKEFLGTSWIVSELTENDTNVPVTNDVILTIKSTSEFTLKLDKNNCFGTYTITGNKNIKLSNLGCTEMCCDSDFSIAVSNALYNVTKVNFEKERATLSGDNVKIKFKKYEVVTNRIKMMNDNERFVKEDKTRGTDGTDIGLITKPTGNQQSNTSLPKGEAITLYKSPCKGSCEEYTMMLYADGTVLYTGRFNAEIQGKHVVKLTTGKSKQLFTEFEQANFGNYQDKYDNERIMDLQNTYLTYKGKKIHIRDKYSAPDALKVLLEKVEERAAAVLLELKKK